MADEKASAKEAPEERKEEHDRVIPRLIEVEMKSSYIDYAMSVIVGRALPDVRDGLKPVHRRILFAMNSMGMTHNKPFKKCARIVGDTLGRYHPHGDMAVFDALVRMVQTFSLRYPLIQGQGNFGCFTADTKVKLTDGRNLSFAELVEEHKKGKINFTFTVDEKGIIKIAEIKKPRLTKKHQEIMKVVLDNDEEIKCTLNHKFMLKDGSYVEAKDLKPGDSLMPSYFRHSTKEDDANAVGYSMIFQPASSTWNFVHVLADEWNLSEEGQGRKISIPSNKGLEKYCARNKNLLLCEMNGNHKVAKVEFLREFADVYDLTVDKTHNFALAAGVFVHNSIDGDSAAAMRYVEARMAKIGEEMLVDIEKATVPFTPNFDGSLKEPMVLPSRIPNLLVNGSSGIAVGMATNIPPHNINEVADAAVMIINNPEISTKELMQKIPGPDFPTGGIICGSKGILDYFSTGRGKMLVRAKTKMEEKGNRQAIIVTEIPYQVNKSMLLEEIVMLIKEKKVMGISDLRDESDRKGIRVVIDIKSGYNPELVLNQLFKHSRMQTTFGVIMLALVNNEPVVLNLKNTIKYFIVHRRKMVIRRTQFNLKKAMARAHVLKGLMIALSHVDDVVKKIRASKSVDDAKNVLMNDYSLTEIQAKAILEMKLQKLASLEQEKIKQEYTDLLEIIKELKAILSDEQRILGIIKSELQEIKEAYGDERRTMIEDVEMEIETKDLVKKEDVVVTCTHSGYIKRIPLETYKQQKRGGKGVIAAETKEEDIIKHLFIANTHDYILFFTDYGKVHWKEVYEIPEGSRQSKGRPIVNLFSLEKDEKITTMIPVSEFKDGLFLLMATRNGTIKKTSLQEYSNPRKGGIIAITLDEGDKLVDVVMTDGAKQVIIATANGMAVKFDEKDARPIGRAAKGVRGISLKKDDSVIGLDMANDSKTLITITENGYGKRTPIEDYRLINRGGVGVINIKTSDRNGKVVSIQEVSEEDEIFLISQQGIIIRMPVKDISVIGRNTQGVRLMKMHVEDKVVACAKVAVE